MMLFVTQIKHLWRSLDHKITVNQRELLLGFTTCALAGVVAGMFLSPNKQISIGCHNGSNNEYCHPQPQEAAAEPEAK